jgi:hypothetical protein
LRYILKKQNRPHTQIWSACTYRIHLSSGYIGFRRFKYLADVQANLSSANRTGDCLLTTLKPSRTHSSQSDCPFHPTRGSGERRSSPVNRAAQPGQFEESCE